MCNWLLGSTHCLSSLDGNFSQIGTFREILQSIPALPRAGGPGKEYSKSLSKTYSYKDKIWSI